MKAPITQAIYLSRRYGYMFHHHYYLSNLLYLKNRRFNTILKLRFFYLSYNRFMLTHFYYSLNGFDN